MIGQIRFPLLLMGIFALLAGLWAGLLNEVAILLFLGLVFYSLSRAK